MMIQIEWRDDTGKPDSRGAVFVNGTDQDASPFFKYFWRTDLTSPSDPQERLYGVKKDLKDKVQETVQRADVREEILRVIESSNFERDPMKRRDEFKPQASVRIWYESKWHEGLPGPISGSYVARVR
jgi:hypothetical protein